MTNRIEPEISSFTADVDQAPSQPNHPHTRKINSPTSTPVNTGVAIKNSSSLANKFALALVYIALAGASYWFYLENIKLKDLQADAEQRIVQLEQQLSATGEEIGESTVALKIKLEALTEKSNELWLEMDKLWASAWRRNQSEIKELRSQSIALNKNVDSNSQNLKNNASIVSEIKEKQTATDFSLNAISEQIASSSKLKDEVAALSKQVNTLSQTANTREKQQMEVATSVNQVDTSLQILLERIEQLEAQLKLQANKPLAPSQIN
ncbi:hypothetical protein [Thalassotalea profundi]|uniref:Chromosome segregation ATPase n=1 Tax=Thalassotalea profundi TaxID=2036687 RepID=A0ABQ3IGH1_9GAMM|nr:hypothetical protein [Thalassotalea profundi]GHE83709.1 hypothetical protein GCM10011501_10400 [Thalassotalea profundi]